MAVWNGILGILDSTEGTTRNVAFEHTLAWLVAVLAIGWVLTPVLDHLRWSHLAWYTIAAVPFMALLYYVTKYTNRDKNAIGV